MSPRADFVLTLFRDYWAGNLFAIIRSYRVHKQSCPAKEKMDVRSFTWGRELMKLLNNYGKRPIIHALFCFQSWTFCNIKFALLWHFIWIWECWVYFYFARNEDFTGWPFSRQPLTGRWSEFGSFEWSKSAPRQRSNYEYSILFSKNLIAGAWEFAARCA